MDWLALLLAELAAGREVQIRGSGPSMRGRIEDGEYVVLSPRMESLQREDIVLVKVPNGRHYVHVIKEIEGERYLIGNMLGEIDGWVERGDIRAKVVRIGRDSTFAGLTVET